ncbi:MAG: GAF domain-containing protein [Cyclobacteriaceae bacterium]|nr:GAF domain-containing protein [Cyclobacteriaceae bacterium]
MEKKRLKSRMRLTIGNKILAGFSALMILYIINVAIIFFTRTTIQDVVTHSSDTIRPSQNAINDFILLVTRSKMLATNWVYLQSNEEDKQALRNLRNNEYPQLAALVKELMPRWESDSQRMLMDSVFIKFDAVLQVQEEGIMKQLVSFDNYEDPVTKLLAEDVVANQIIPQSNEIIEILSRIATTQNSVTAESDAALIRSVRSLGNVTWILAGVFIGLGMLSAFLLMRSITVPVNFLKNIVVKLGRGELVEEKRKNFSNDEIGEMAVAMDNLVNGLKQTTMFAENIGKGNYKSEFRPLSEHDVLGNALLNMRDNLAKVAEEDKQRNWATEGMARFGEILRTNNNDLVKLADEIIRNLVKYLDANQGAIYIVDDVDAEVEPTMSMKACYAWDKKKFLNHQIHKGEGLAGQAWQEGNIIYLTEVPDNYVRIVSGLGDANPTSILIVPLKVNDDIFGVVEIASFAAFKDFEIEFVKKVAESIASTISSVKVNARTQRLLEESQEMTEQMRAQEEEMRQNMEELQATQEEMQRSQAETESTMTAINASMAVAEYDTDGKITKINSNYLDMMGYNQDEVLGEHQRIFATKEEKMSEEFRHFWKDLAGGISKAGVFTRMTKRGETIRLRSSFSPIQNRSGEVVKIMEIAYLVS